MPIPAPIIATPEWETFYGPTDGIGVTIGDTLLHAYESDPDEHGVRWGLTALDGWFDGWVGASSAVDQRSQQDGAWISPQYATPRVIHASGRVEAQSWDAVTRAWDRLLATIPFRHLAPLTVTTGEGSMAEMIAQVRQHEKPILTRRGKRATFSLSLLAPDPRRYASTLRTTSLVLPILSGGIAPPLTTPLTITGSTSLSQATLTNDGTVTTYPALTITGPCPPATIINLTTSEAIRVVDAVPAGQTLVIDVLAGTATTGGQSRRVLGSWWGIEPGANEVAFRADGYDAAAALSISYRSAWK